MLRSGWCAPIRLGARMLAIGILLAASAALLTGCGVLSAQLEAASTFAKSTSQLADSAKSAYLQAGQDESTLRVVRYAVLGNPQDSPKLISAGNYQKPLLNLMPSYISIKGRLDAAAALSAYGQALTALLDSKTQEGDLAAATDKFTAALKSIPAKDLTAAGIKTAEIDSAGAILKAFGNLYLDYRRREALEQVVPATEPVVTKLCKMFRNDFDILADGQAFAQVYYNSTDNILTAVTRKLKSDADSQGNGGDGLERRAILLPMYMQVAAIKNKTKDTYATVKTAGASCATASQTLADSIKNPTVSLDDIIDFAKKADAAYTAVTAFAAGK